MHWIVSHPELVRALGLAAYAALLFGVLYAATMRSRRPRHRTWRRAVDRGHEPLHAAVDVDAYHPRHEVGGAVELGRGVDGDLALVHADEPALAGVGA